MTDDIELPPPAPTTVSLPYWRAAHEGRLILRGCRACGASMFYPRDICPRCASVDLDWREASGQGSVYAHTVVHRAPTKAFRARAPYVIAIIDLDEGPRMMANVTDCAPEEVRIGMRVRAWFEPRGEGLAIPQFRPLSER